MVGGRGSKATPIQEYAKETFYILRLQDNTQRQRKQNTRAESTGIS